MNKVNERIREYVVELTGIPIDLKTNPVEWIIASHHALSDNHRRLIEENEELKRVLKLIVPYLEQWPNLQTKAKTLAEKKSVWP